MKNFVQDGDVITVTVTDTDGITSGTAMLLGNLFGVACIDAAVGEQTELAVVGVFTLPKKTTVAIDQGDRVFVDPSDGAVTDVSTTGLAAVGVAVESAATSATEIDVRLDGISTSTV
jgi:predicted RecA/RadA family phage recombinase